MGPPGPDNIYGSGRLNLEPPADTIPPTVNAFSVTPASLIIGNAFTIFYTVSDTGGSGLNHIELWRANDNYGVPSGWTEITSAYLSGNGPASGSFTDIPSSIGSFWYGITVIDNAANWSEEPNPPGPAKVLVLGPDLTGAWTSLAQNCKSTNKGLKCSIKGKVNIQNIGNLDAASSFVRFYLSDDALYDLSDTFLKQATTGKIKMGRNKSKSFSYKFQIGMSATGKYIVAVIDADNTVHEANEYNNNIPYGPMP